LIVGVGLRYFPKKVLTPPKNENTNQATEWQTYKDEKSGVEVRVPAMMQTRPVEQSNNVFSFVLLGDQQGDAAEFEDGYYFDVFVYKNIASQDLQNWIDSQDIQADSTKDLQLSNKLVKRLNLVIEGDYEWPGDDVAYYFINGDNIINYVCHTSGYKHAEYLEQCENIIQNNVK